MRFRYFIIAHRCSFRLKSFIQPDINMRVMIPMLSGYYWRIVFVILVPKRVRLKRITIGYIKI